MESEAARQLPESLHRVAAEHDLSLPLVVLSGSRAYGTEFPESDDDYGGIFIGGLRSRLSLDGPGPDTFAGTAPDFTIHEIGKFCRLALKGNPAVLEMLWNPNVIMSDEWGRELVALRNGFLHRGSLDVYVAYAESQMKKMVKGRGLHSKGGVYNGKHGAHLVRLLSAGLHLARTGEVLVRVEADLASLLKKIRRQELSMPEVLDVAKPLLSRLMALSTTNTLPEHPALEAVNDLVVRARLSRR